MHFFYQNNSICPLRPLNCPANYETPTNRNETKTGFRRCTSATKAHTAGYFILYGQNIYGYILLGDVNQVVGARLQGVLHECVVLA